MGPIWFLKLDENRLVVHRDNLKGLLYLHRTLWPKITAMNEHNQTYIQQLKLRFIYILPWELG